MSYANIIGRNKEINILDRIYKSKKSELVAIYGRRRVG
jgi:AAA+ ATPase superfamily predicted ATPase